MKRAYSYVRFSTAEQLNGKSLERQTEAARIYCAQHKLELDTELSLHDLGVSAFRGKNAVTGALGSFLKAVHVGQVPKGSFLLIETFDRMSRESAYDAQLTLQNIINAGITVVTLMDGKQYNVAILRSDPLALIYAILLMSRSHEESATKSKRIADAWRRKRAGLHERKQVLTTLTPGWIAVDRHRKLQLIPERAKVVQRIFAELLDGNGRTTIASNLNRDHVPTFRGGQWWTGAYVNIILRSRAVLGEFQPHKTDPASKGGRAPDGPPIPNYFPAVIDVRTFNRVQRRLEEMKVTGRAPRGGLKNILAGLARCPRCGGLMDRIIKVNRTRLVCSRARADAGCTYRSISLSRLEQALALVAPRLAGDVPDTSTDLQERMGALQEQQRALQIRITDMALLLSDTPSRTVATRIQADEAELERIEAEINMLNTQLTYGSARRVRDNVSRMRSALQWHVQDPSDAAGVNAALRDCFDAIVVDFDKKRLEMRWRHGGHVSYVPYEEGKCP